MYFKKLKKNNIIAILALMLLGYIYYNPNILEQLFYSIGILVAIMIILYTIYQGKNSRRTYDMKEIDRMNGLEFEKYLVQLYRNQGYKVTHVGGSGDYGSNKLNRKSKKYKQLTGMLGTAALTELLK